MPRARRRRWSAYVTTHSNALDLDAGVFTKPARAMARSLKRSAERSTRRKASPFRSAMSMLTFYGNRAGKHLGPRDRARLEAAKRELRRLFGKAPGRAVSGSAGSRGRRRGGAGRASAT